MVKRGSMGFFFSCIEDFIVGVSNLMSTYTVLLSRAAGSLCRAQLRRL